MDQKYTNDTTFSYYKDLDENCMVKKRLKNQKVIKDILLKKRTKRKIGALGASFLGNMLTGKGIVEASYGNKNQKEC